MTLPAGRGAGLLTDAQADGRQPGAGATPPGMAFDAATEAEYQAWKAKQGAR
jgi:hypothetical protein